MLESRPLLFTAIVRTTAMLLIQPGNLIAGVGGAGRCRSSPSGRGTDYPSHSEKGFEIWALGGLKPENAAENSALLADGCDLGSRNGDAADRRKAGDGFSEHGQERSPRGEAAFRVRAAICNTDEGAEAAARDRRPKSRGRAVASLFKVTMSPFSSPCFGLPRRHRATIAVLAQEARATLNDVTE